MLSMTSLLLIPEYVRGHKSRHFEDKENNDLASESNLKKIIKINVFFCNE